jgi:hypothetical protein
VSPRLVHLVALGAMSTLALVLYREAVDIPVYDIDNLFSLSVGPSVGTRESLLSLLTGKYDGLPAYRPVSLFALWLQYNLAGIAPESYFVVNIVLLVGACAVLYALVYRMTGSWPAACAPAFALLVDPRIFTIVTGINERETALACLLGLLALLAVLAPPVRARPRPIAIAVFVLLLLAALTKEYGLAFSAAVFVAALLNPPARSRPVVVAVLAAVLTYAALRWFLVGGATGDYCDDMGYFDEVRLVCFGHQPHGAGAVRLTAGAALAQHAYNVGAAFLGTFFPFLFHDLGYIASRISAVLVGWSVIVTGLALLAWRRIPHRSLPFLALLVANSILSLTLYRERNLVIGMVGLYAAAALGAVEAADWLRSRNVPLRQLGIATVASALVLWLGYQSFGRLNDVNYQYQSRIHTLAQIRYNKKKKRQTKDPCVHAGRTPWGHYVDPSVVHYLKLRYKLPNAACRRARPAPV